VQVFEHLRSSSRDLRRFLMGAMLLGVGQQIFVVLRNQYLADLGWPSPKIPAVQGAGAVAGVIVGAVWIVWGGRLRWSIALAGCALVQALGFVMQIVGGGVAAVFAGAAVAGLAIQSNTALAPPFLKGVTSQQERVAVFSIYTMALFPIAGVLGAMLIALATWSLGPELHAQRVALAIGAATSLLAALAYVGIARKADPVSPPLRPRAPGRILACASVHALLGLAGGITLPFLQLYFKVTFGVAPHEVAFVYGGTMVVGIVGYLIAPILASRFGSWQTTIVLLVVTIPLFAELAVARSIGVAAAVFVVRHTLMNMTTPVMQSFYQEVAATGDGPAMSASTVMASAATWACGTFLAGPLLAADHGRFGRAMFATGIVYGVAALAALFVFPWLWRTRTIVGE